MDIYLERDGQQVGPFSQEQVGEMIHAGYIEKTDKMWHEGLQTWCCLGMRQEYSGLFSQVEQAAVEQAAAATPPPLPPEISADTVPPAPSVSLSRSPSTEPVRYRPGMRSTKQESAEAEEADSFVTQLEDAPKVTQWIATWLDGLVVGACLWMISLVLLPDGLGVTDLNNYGEGMYDAYDDPVFQDKLTELEDRFYEDEEADWDDYDAEYEALEKEWAAQRATTMDAGDRYLMGAATSEEMAQVSRYYIVAVVFGLLFTVFQYFILATKGQTIGKMFMDIKLINECTRQAPGHNIALVIHCFFPRFKLAETAVVKV